MRRVYPISILVLGHELQGTQASPFAHSVTRLMPNDWLETLSVTRQQIAKVETIVVLGPGLIDRIAMGPFILYDRRSSNDEDGRLFFAPFRILELGHVLSVNVRCSPELFQFDAADPLPAATAEDEPIIDCAPGWGKT